MTKPAESALAVVTAGEPAGIGPELVLSLADTAMHDRIVVIADLVGLPDVHLVAGLEVSPDDVVGVDHGVRSDDGGVADDRGQLPVTLPARRGAHDAEVLEDRSHAQRDVLVHLRCHDRPGAHDSIPRRHFLGRKRSWTSASFSIDS
jgi:hypothetical protein